MARLIVESGGERREIKVAGPVTLGRSPSATIAIDDKVLSREHTQVYLQGGKLWVKDLESKNGTYLNGQLLKQAELLRNGDRIKVGPAVLTVLLDPGESAPAPAVAKPAPAPPPAPAAPQPARARTRSAAERDDDAGPNPFAAAFQKLFLLGVVLVGAFLSKGIFLWLLDRVPKPQ